MDTATEKKTALIDRILLALLSIAWLATQLYFSLIKPVHPMIQVPLFLAFAVAITFIRKPIKIKALRFLDYVCAVLIGYMAYYFVSNSDVIVYRIPHVSKLSSMDIAVVLMMVVLLLEAVRRVLGLNLYLFVIFFIVYAFLGKYFPGFMRYEGMNVNQFTEVVGMATDGIFGSPLTTTANYIFFFMLFGAFFAVCGGGQVLIDIGLKASRNGGAGAPAQAAVISSGLMGMVSGSAVANVSTTGVLTIPMMKKVGYTPEQAGAIEAVASTGGQIMPPIMGVGAFIMAELLGVKYGEVATRAIIPACAYFGSVLFLVSFIAKRNLEKGLVKNNVDANFEIEPILPRLYKLIPALILVYLVMTGSSLRSAAILSSVSVLLIFLVVRKPGEDFKERLIADLKILWFGLMDGIQQSADVALPTGICGVIIGVVVQSGLANKFSVVVSTIGGEHLLIALIITLIGCMLLGMALPTLAAYLIAYVLFIPTLTRLGLNPIVSHFFCFYYGIVAQITPPVCLASFTAAGIAGADSWETGWTGFRYALVAFLIPFVFVYQPAVLLLGTSLEVVEAIIVLAMGTLALASAMGGYLFASLDTALERFLMLAAAFLLITPELITDVIGGVLFVLSVMMSWRKKQHIKKETLEAKA